jgi:hypothetical protein
MQMGHVKGGVPIFPVLDSGTHDIGALYEAVENWGSSPAWTVGRTLIPLIAAVLVIGLLYPGWSWVVRRCQEQAPSNSAKPAPRAAGDDTRVLLAPMPPQSPVAGSIQSPPPPRTAGSGPRVAGDRKRGLPTRAFSSGASGGAAQSLAAASVYAAVASEPVLQPAAASGEQWQSGAAAGV